MNCIRGILTLRLALFALGVVLLPAGLYKAAMAQGQDIIDDEIYDASDFCNPGDDCEVESVADILASTYYGGDTDINTYNATFITFDLLDYGYEAYVEGYLYQDGSLFADGSAGDDGSGEAQLDGANPLTLYDYYELDTDSYITDGIDYYGFPCDGCTSAAVEMDSSVPSLTSVNPTDASVGTQGTLTLSGSNFLDPFGGDSYVNYSGTGVTFTLQSFDDQSVVLTYSIQDGASTGEQTFTIQDRFGTSDPVSFNVGDATPVVTSVNPGTWQAGTQFTVTISGQHFGTNPSVSLLNATAVTISPPTSSGDTQIQATVTVSQDAPNETVTVQVQSNGYGGSGFVATYPGESPDGTDTANVVANLPPPTIVIGTDISACGGTNIANQNQTVFAGQQITIVGCIPQGVQGTNPTWSVQSILDLTGGYCAPYAYTQCTDNPNAGEELADPMMTNANISFYWVNPGTTEVATFTYTDSVSGLQASAPVPYTIQGPTGVSVANDPNYGGFSPVEIYWNTIYNASWMGLGYGKTKPSQSGIVLSVQPWAYTSGQNGTGQNSTYTWVQLINNDKIRLRYDQSFNAACSGAQSCTCYPPGLPGAAELDSFYPYSNSNKANSQDFVDSPGTPLADNEQEQVFSATTYLMWDPALGSAGCTPAYVDASNVPHQSTCSGSIPVPLGTISWNWSGDAVDTGTAQPNGTYYILEPGCTPFEGAFTQSTAAYPPWQAIAGFQLPLGKYSCTKDPQ